MAGSPHCIVRKAARRVSLDDYVADVLHAVAAIGKPAALLGHSMGAIVVQRAWREAQAAALVLLALNSQDIFN